MKAFGSASREEKGTEKKRGGLPRAVSLTIDGTGNLTHLDEASPTNAANPRDFAYDGQHHLTRDLWAPLDATFTYGSTGHLANVDVDLGLGTTYAITSMAEQALGEPGA